MIKKFSSYETTKAYSDYPQLPRGGYILKIMGAELGKSQNGEYIKISCDIIEGEYKDFFANDYRSQQKEDKKWHCNYILNVPNDDGTERDGWTARRFKTVIEDLESANPGYHFDWDEQKFKGKTIGGIFNYREYEKSDGSVGQTANLAQLCNPEKIRKGTYKIPEDRKPGKKAGSAPRPDSEEFMQIPENSIEDLPFN